MDTCQLLSLMNTMDTKTFKGVFPIDLLPQAIQPPAAFIINLDPSDRPGSHWVALYVLDKRSCPEYFDSFALPPPPPLDTLPCTTRNTSQIQSDFSTLCGLYCAAFLHHRIVLRKSFTDFLAVFHPDHLCSNDAWILDAMTPFLHSTSCVGQTGECLQSCLTLPEIIKAMGAPCRTHSAPRLA